MTTSKRSWSICIVLACYFISHVVLSAEEAFAHSQIVLATDLASGAPKPLDMFSELDRMARDGVDPVLVNASMKGDGRKAVSIGDRFSRLGKFVEARYWFSIAAENGDGVGMQRLSTLLRSSDCVRANYWLKKALLSGDLKGASLNANRLDLKKYEAECKK